MMMWFQDGEAERILQGRNTANGKELDLEASFDIELLKCKAIRLKLTLQECGALERGDRAKTLVQVLSHLSYLSQSGLISGIRGVQTGQGAQEAPIHMSLPPTTEFFINNEMIS